MMSVMMFATIGTTTNNFKYLNYMLLIKLYLLTIIFQ